MDYFSILFHRKNGDNVPIDGKFYESLFAVAGEWEETTIVGVPPIIFLAKGDPLSDYLISGNTVQNGTPSPDNPVDVVGCGERTENLFDDFQNINMVPRIADGKLINYSGKDGTGAACTEFIPIQNGDMTLKSYSGNFSMFIFLYDADKNYIGNVGYENANHDIVSSASVAGSRNARFMRVRTDTYAMYTANTKLMLNTGSISKPYEPYGFKLPVTVNGTEYPIYLGQVPTTRRVKKLVLTGDETENWNYVPSGDISRFRINLADSAAVTELKSTHYVYELANAYGNAFVNTSLITLTICHSLTTVYAFKTYLAQQYAAGTPVTVWYVIATPGTAVVNEPLMKIGDYADTISMAQAVVTIPTVAGANTLTFDTIVQPSEVSITGNIKEVQGT